MPNPTECAVHKALGVPAFINAGSSVHRFWMDPDDCDLWDMTTKPPSRVKDNPPYED